MDTPHHLNNDDLTPRANRPVAAVLTVTAGLLTGLIRLVPHPGNFTAMGALGLFGGARLRSWYAFALPLAVMAVTDCALWMLRGFDSAYPPWSDSQWPVYASFLIYVAIGRALARTNAPKWIGLGSVLGSVQFFLITNFFAWAAIKTYSRDISGLVTCYLAGLPFYDPSNPVGYFGWTLLGDLGFSAVLFGAYAWLARTVPVPDAAGAAEDLH
jgi:hypothetical protein